MAGQLLSDVEAFAASLRKASAVNVNDQSSKDRAIELASAYFRNDRPTVASIIGETDVLLALDADWQQLVRLAHGNNARRSYLRILSSLRRQLSELSIAAVSTPATHQSRSAYALSREEELLVRTLESLVPSAAASYRQGLLDLYGGERLSYRGTASEFREALRETLDHLAPDEDVMAQAGFKLEDKQTKPTMAQKTRHILKSRQRNSAQRAAAEKMLGLIEQVAGEVTRAVYNRASVATHVQQARIEVQQIKRYVDTVLFDLLEIG